MTSAEFRAACARLGVSPPGVAALCGAKGRPSWARPDDAGPVPPGVAALVRLAEGLAARMDYAALAELLRREAATLEAAGLARAGSRGAVTTGRAR